MFSVIDGVEMIEAQQLGQTPRVDLVTLVAFPHRTGSAWPLHTAIEQSEHLTGSNLRSRCRPRRLRPCGFDNFTTTQWYLAIAS
jgi:hypothetical protein